MSCVRCNKETGDGCGLCADCYDIVSQETCGQMTVLRAVGVTEYRCETLPIKAGEGAGCTAEILNRFAGEGWRVLSMTAVAVKLGGSAITGDEKIGQGLFVVFQREKR